MVIGVIKSFQSSYATKSALRPLTTASTWPNRLLLKSPSNDANILKHVESDDERKEAANGWSRGEEKES